METQEKARRWARLACSRPSLSRDGKWAGDERALVGKKDTYPARCPFAFSGDRPHVTENLRQAMTKLEKIKIDKQRPDFFQVMSALFPSLGNHLLCILLSILYPSLICRQHFA